MLFSAAGAQQRLIGAWTVSTGVLSESYQFGDGLLQTARTSGTSSVVKAATQWVVPVALDVPLGSRWNVDVASTVARGEVRFAPTGAGGETSAALSGVGDVRLRLTGRLVGDNLLLTVGANAATGVRELTTEQIAALGVLAAPALGSALPAASNGPSATTGLVWAVARGGWSWAAGAGVEVRGRYAPIAALTAGVPAAEFSPGTAIHLSLGSNGFIGDAALSVTATADVYAEDRMASTDGPATGTVHLGPTVGLEAQWRAPTTRFRELTVYAAERYRAPFSRDGAQVDGTSAGYLSAGLHSAYPLGRWTDFTASADFWSHTGFAYDNVLVTANTTSGALGLGIAQRVGAYTLQPYVRLRAGTVRTGVGSADVTGVGAGLNLLARF